MRHVGKFDSHEVTRQYVALCKDYHVSEVVGDAYAREWVAGAWRSAGVEYRKSLLPKSGIYLECVPLFTRGLVRLPDHTKLLRELRLLERQTHRGGKDSVDHPRNASDDYANAACGALQLVGKIEAFPDPPIVMPVIAYRSRAASPAVRTMPAMLSGFRSGSRLGRRNIPQYIGTNRRGVKSWKWISCGKL